ncbi:substrate-binding domain-containing protein [Pseudomonas corrugata]|uniref:Substrate-binding domain-containing protein n=1 Tax=Pseudomonas corrugata TaxID=47879 RepID=A0A7Y5Z1M3_9PSED|nr:substrate-binding domain-containing protein [Pseudomonas corrugata]NUT85057.1 substrate-binding domain-containing protein [Pseudomonas corrugata]
MTIIRGLLSLLVLLATLQAPGAIADLRIGVSMSNYDDVFLATLRNELKERGQKQGVQLQFEDARIDTVMQANQVLNMISQGVDALIVSPVDTAATRPITAAAVKAGIPLVYINRRPDVPTLPAGVVAVYSDDAEAGRMLGQYIAQRLNGKGSIAILMGDPTTNSAQQRTDGYKESLSKYPDIKIVEQQNGLWLRDKAMDITTGWLLTGQTIDAILANNDEMAIGAAMALGRSEKSTILVGGVDGTADGLTAIKRKMLAVSAFQDAGEQASRSIALCKDMIEKRPVQDVVIPMRLITPDNLGEFYGARL